MEAAATQSHDAANVATLEKSASMDTGALKTGDLKTGETQQSPGSPTGVWEYLFPSQSNGESEVHCPDVDDDISAATGTTGGHSILSQRNLAPVPERLVDFFCVVGPDFEVIRDFAQTPSDLHLAPKLIDCYPKYRSDVDFPRELPMFCLPNGCQLSTQERTPTLSTFVLTTSTGNRMYGSVLTSFELVPLEDLCQAFWRGECVLPAWLEESRPFFLPKSLIVISHHAFYQVQQNFLQQLHRISISGRSPLPLERYVANFVHDVPLPRPGAASVLWKCLTKDTSVTYRRPAINELPLVNFSYQPLFRALSVSNILTLWGILLQEGRVVLCSDNLALLTPVAEALTSFLFPFTWQGMYVPVLPSNMTDVLEAPFPFLVGVVGRSYPQPDGVVICDLDQDIVHLGMDDQTRQPRTLPQLPKTLVASLKHELQDVADPMYLIPPCGIKGRITTAVHGLLENTMREPYAQMRQLRDMSLSNTHRHYILSNANRLPTSSPLKDGDFILVGEEQTKYQSQDSSSKPKNRREGGNFFNALRRGGRAFQTRTDRVFSFTPAGATRYDEEMEQKKDAIAQNLYAADDDLSQSVRYSFLRFFSSLFMRYKEYTRRGTFKHVDFVNSLTEMSYGNRLYVESIVTTQMFERFWVESSTRRRLFDEHILVQVNENMVLASNKQDTPFLDELSSVTKIIIPAAPCSVGVRRGNVFPYENGFPKLDGEEMVAHKNLDPVSALCYLGSDLLCGAADW